MDQMLCVKSRGLLVAMGKGCVWGPLLWFEGIPESSCSNLFLQAALGG